MERAASRTGGGEVEREVRRWQGLPCRELEEERGCRGGEEEEGEV